MMATKLMIRKWIENPELPGSTVVDSWRKRNRAHERQGARTRVNKKRARETAHAARERRREAEQAHEKTEEETKSTRVRKKVGV